MLSFCLFVFPLVGKAEGGGNPVQAEVRKREHRQWGQDRGVTQVGRWKLPEEPLGSAPSRLACAANSASVLPLGWFQAPSSSF